ncbi:hypothetical protein OUZ56_029312 [Daphnia magna]|uniref:Uncharacterized protein n=1 Tax=Daphnia magna TaxID=35525 RepID=A0ABR0B6H0_9CRUS|nr:hypothetical protein OUZ56_029312 [Daphnia magna]
MSGQFPVRQFPVAAHLRGGALMLGALSVTFTLDILYIGKQQVWAQCCEELLFLEQHGVCDGKLIKRRLSTCTTDTMMIKNGLLQEMCVVCHITCTIPTASEPLIFSAEQNCLIQVLCILSCGLPSHNEHLKDDHTIISY